MGEAGSLLAGRTLAWTLAVAGLMSMAGCASQPAARAELGAPTVNLVTVNDQVLVAPDAELTLNVVEDREVCRKVQVTGTRFPQTVCKPASEWSDLRMRQRAEGQEFVRQTVENASIVNQDTSASGPNPGGAQLY